MQINVGDLFIAGEAFTLTPGAWVVMGVNPFGRGLLMLNPQGELNWVPNHHAMLWEHFPAEAQDGDQGR